MTETKAPKPKWVYCRGCNREVLVDEETESYYVEIVFDEGEFKKYHAKVDCDPVPA